MNRLPTFEDFQIDQTKEFKEWFKGSKVVDRQGKPLKVYHGTNIDFDEFDIKKQNSGWLSKGFYFTEDKSGAKDFGKIIISAYLNIKNPFIIQPDKIRKDGSVEWAKNAKEQIIEKYPETKDIAWKDISKYLKSKRYDGIINSNNLIVAFYPNQIWILNKL